MLVWRLSDAIKIYESYVKIDFIAFSEAVRFLGTSARKCSANYKIKLVIKDYKAEEILEE